MNYSEAERWLFGRRRMGMKYGLDRMEALMKDLGSPQESFSTVHIVGTNGKGSTAAILSALADELGIRWGRGTSPHLLHYRERIVCSNGWIPEDAVSQFITDNIHLLRKHSATFFEITTAMAAWYFRNEGVEWVAAEAGLGGRLDATRTYRGKGTVFTGVRIEHSRILGDSREKIAAEKVAVAEPGTCLFAFRDSQGVEEVIDEAVKKNRLKRIVPDLLATGPLPGEHQRHNGSLAYAAASALFGRPEESVREAYGRLASVMKWPGRLDFRRGSPCILFDVAHNCQSMEALVAHIAHWSKPVPAVVGFLSDKPWKDMVKLLEGVVDPVVVTTPESERKLPAEELAAYMSSRGFQVVAVDPIPEAVARCRRMAGNDRMLVTGSFFVVGGAINSSVDSGWVSGVPDDGRDCLD